MSRLRRLRVDMSWAPGHCARPRVCWPTRLAQEATVPGPRSQLKTVYASLERPLFYRNCPHRRPANVNQARSPADLVAPKAAAPASSSA